MKTGRIEIAGINLMSPAVQSVRKSRGLIWVEFTNGTSVLVIRDEQSEHIRETWQAAQAWQDRYGTEPVYRFGYQNVGAV